LCDWQIRTVGLIKHESTYLTPLFETIRFFNLGSIPLEIIEVQAGSFLAEDDIVLFDDSCDRVIKVTLQNLNNYQKNC
jgi:hypothetical protein